MNLDREIYKHFRIRNIFFLFLLYISISVFLYFRLREILYINMVWNVFLAFLPLLFATWIIRLHARLSWILKIFLCVLWLIFFPNAPYMVTDFIHISGVNFYLGHEEYSQMLSSTSMILWTRIAYIGIGVLMGLLSGLLSLHMIHCTLYVKLEGFFSSIVLGFIFLLTGLGVYAGRFLRLNSWNLIHPHRILDALYASLSTFSIKFILLYAFFTFAIYVVYCILCPIIRFQEI